ncbi:putative membrane protein YdjX (TVP38/TMEM64 family) [Halorubrum trapanicum]|uniref:Putative membrane protein YdjX (TVP38/TMEM64 family) n=1 Tax=Halorubrum trapanicum TaxID=29284 RepID=A0A8J7RPM6_9EURY|nr:TVP38/TMEM64 family protein [Halorubrum trapanicum]MBP1900987.1 putative membrane protein YdjX (TVP38/TMEM64 family) [Halorubrum trapanicum]
MKLFSSRADRRRGIAAAVGIAVLAVGLYVLVSRYAGFITDAQALRTWLDQFGIFAPIVFVGIQALQVIVAPIPGQVVALVAGYLFGSFWGTVYSLTGVLIGSAVAFSLAKRYGRSFVENVIHEDVIARFDGFVDTVGIPGLFAFVIIPGLPDDAICFLSGLTKWSLPTFIGVIAVGRLPAYVLTVYAGGELASGRFLSAMALVALVVVASAVGYYKQDAVRDLVERFEPRLPF